MADDSLAATKQEVGQLKARQEDALQWKCKAEVEGKALAEWQKMFEDRYISLEQSVAAAVDQDEAAQTALRAMEETVTAIRPSLDAVMTEVASFRPLGQETADLKDLLGRQADATQQAIGELRFELQGHLDTHSAALLMLDEAFRQLETSANGVDRRTSAAEDAAVQLKQQFSDLLASLQAITQRLDGVREELLLRWRQSGETLRQEVWDRLGKHDQLLESHSLDLRIAQNDHRELHDSVQGLQAKAEELRVTLLRAMQSDVDKRATALQSAVERLEGALEVLEGRCQYACNMSNELRDWLQDAQDRCALRSELEERCTHIDAAQRGLRQDLYRTETDLTRKLALSVEATGQEMESLRALLKRAPVHGLIISQHSLPL
eukprot:GGOE01055200.1.p1 GENE.GGOE01055200.1~~GGOE01055200.1.p1  ORF type:complete len:386 (+),score=140.61 GGOE01055200.1:27-1160(+)